MMNLKNRGKHTTLVQIAVMRNVGIFPVSSLSLSSFSIEVTFVKLKIRDTSFVE